MSYKKYFFWRNNSGALETKGGHFVRFGSKGAPDFFVLRAGVLYGLELKGSSGKQSEAQREFQRQMEIAGGVYILARSVEDVSFVISEHQKLQRVRN